MNPYVSRIIPILGHPITTKKKPTPKEIVPCTKTKAKKKGKKNRMNVYVANVHTEMEKQEFKDGQIDGYKKRKERDIFKQTLKFCLFIKNCMVDVKPMVRLTPEMKRIYICPKEASVIKYK